MGRAPRACRDRVAIEDRGVPVVRVRVVGDPRQPQLDQMDATVAAGRAIAAAHGQPVEPGVPCAGVAETRRVTPGLEQRLLDGVFGPVCIAQDERRHRMEASLRGANESLEGLEVPSHHPFDEFTLHRPAHRVANRPHLYMGNRYPGSVPTEAQRVVRPTHEGIARSCATSSGRDRSPCQR